MKPMSLAAALLLTAMPALAQTPGETWWKHVEILAADDMEGRLTGSPGHARAVAYVADRLRALGLEPAGVDGYVQPVALEQQRVIAARSEAALVAGGASTPLVVGRDIIIGARSDVTLVYLKGSHELIHRRMAARHEHFMPVALLDSQFATLQEPTPDERPIIVDVGARPRDIATEIVRQLEERQACSQTHQPMPGGETP